jgi:hypothetical protein
MRRITIGVAQEKELRAELCLRDAGTRTDVVFQANSSSQSEST